MSRARNVNVTRTHPGSCPLLEASAGLSKLAVPSPSFFRSQLPLSPRNEPQRSVFIVGLRPAIPLPVCPWRLQASPPLSLARSFVRLSLWIANIRGLRGSKIRNYFWTLTGEQPTVPSCDRLCSRKVVPLMYKNIITIIISNGFHIYSYHKYNHTIQ